jgi:translation initiation factor IF-2
MSDQATSGEPVSAPATPAGAAPVAATSGDRPIGAFGTAKGSGLARGKRASTPQAAPAATPVSNYKPTAVEVITPQREYTNPFASETPAPAPVNEPAPQAAPVPQPEANGPVTSASDAPAATAPAAGEPVAAPAEVIQPSVEKAEIKILPPAEAKRPAVSWGDAAQDPEDTRPAPEPRPTFQPERREPRKFEPREPRKFEPREPRAFEPRSPAGEPRDQRPHGDRERSFQPQPAAAQPKGGFIAWLKGLFGAKPAPQPVQSDDRQPRDGEFHRRRHRGGRGRGGYQGGDNRGPRDGQPRQDFQGQGGNPNFQGGEQGQGERRFEGGGRRRRRGGRGRYRDDRGPRPEGQQGGGAI